MQPSYDNCCALTASSAEEKAEPQLVQSKRLKGKFYRDAVKKEEGAEAEQPSRHCDTSIYACVPTFARYTVSDESGLFPLGRCHSLLAREIV